MEQEKFSFPKYSVLLRFKILDQNEIDIRYGEIATHETTEIGDKINFPTTKGFCLEGTIIRMQNEIEIFALVGEGIYLNPNNDIQKDLFPEYSKEKSNQRNPVPLLSIKRQGKQSEQVDQGDGSIKIKYE